MKGKFLLITILITLFISSKVLASDLSGLNKFYNLDVFSNNSDLKIDIELTKDVENVGNPKLFKKSFEVILDKSYITPAKRIFSVGDSLIDSVYVVQFSKDKVKLRFIFGDKVLVSDRDIQVKTNSNKISIYLKRPFRKQINANSDSTGFIEKEEPVTIKNITEPEIKSAARPVLEPKSDVYINKEKLVKPPKSIAEEVKDIKETPFDLDLPETKDKTDKNMAFLNDSKLRSFLRDETILNKQPLNPTNKDSANMYYASFKMIGSLLLTLTIMFFIAFIFKKYSKNTVFGAGKPIKVLSTCYIGSKSSIALVDVLGEVLVVGITGSNISMLTKLTDEEKIKQIKNLGTADIQNRSFIENFISGVSKIKVSKKERLKKSKEPKRKKKKTNDDHGFNDFLDTVMKDDIVETQSKDKSIEKVAGMIQEKLTKIRST